MPKGLAIFVLIVLTMGSVGIWATLNGYEDAAMMVLLVLLAIFGTVAACAVAFLVFEAVRSLFRRP